MNATRELTEALIAGGMHPADAAMLVARAGVEMASSGPSKATLRTRKWRANKASQNVTGDDSVTLDETVTERHKPSQNVTGDDAPLSLAVSIDQKKLSESKQKREANRGCRLPENWEPPRGDLEAAIAAIGASRADDELAKFRDYWKAQPGSKGVKSDWPATWRNWYRRALEYGGKINGNGTGGSRSDQGAQQSGSAAIMAGVAAAAERRGRERSAIRSDGQKPRDGDAASEPDFEFGGTPHG